MPAQEFETGNLTIAIMDPTAFGQDFRPAGGSSVVLQVDDFEASKAELEGKGVKFVTDTIDSGICHQAYFTDPDGNVLESTTDTRTETAPGISEIRVFVTLAKNRISMKRGPYGGFIRRGGIRNPRYAETHNSFRDCPIQPLAPLPG